MKAFLLIVRGVCFTAVLFGVLVALLRGGHLDPPAAMTAACLSSSLSAQNTARVLEVLTWLSPTFGAYRQMCDSRVHTERDYDTLMESRWYLVRTLLNAVVSDSDASQVPLACRMLDSAGLIRDMHTQFLPFYILEKVLNTFEVVYTILTHPALMATVVLLPVVAMALVGSFLWAWLRKAAGIRQRACEAKMHPREVRDAFKRFTDKVKLPTPKAHATDHLTLATERRLLERWALDTAYSCARKVRDVGGSLKRNSHRGPSLHICFPDIDAADHARRDHHAGNCRNDVGYHSLNQCDNQAGFSIFVYSDFHISLDHIADSLHHPALVITHDFVDGDIDWYDGEAVGKVGNGCVDMETRGGTSYSHPFHQWQAEGFIMGKQRASHYSRVGKFGQSTVYYLYPGTGSFSPLDPARLTDRVKEYYQLSDGIVATLSGHPRTYTFRKGTSIVWSLPATTVERCVVALFGAKRGDTYSGNMNGVIRGRLTQDKLDFDHVQLVIQLVQLRCDEAAISLGHKYLRLPEVVIDMPLLTRVKAHVLVMVHQHLYAVSRRLGDWFRRSVVGGSADTSMMPFLWTDSVCPNYGVYTDLDTTTHGEPRDNRDRQPFHPQSENRRSRSDGEQQRNTPPRPRERIRFTGDESAKQELVPSPTDSDSAFGRSLPSTSSNSATSTPSTTPDRITPLQRHALARPHTGRRPASNHGNTPNPRVGTDERQRSPANGSESKPHAQRQEGVRSGARPFPYLGPPRQTPLPLRTRSVDEGERPDGLRGVAQAVPRE